MPVRDHFRLNPIFYSSYYFRQTANIFLSFSNIYKSWNNSRMEEVCLFVMFTQRCYGDYIKEMKIPTKI
jgi:hypothetical protein